VVDVVVHCTAVQPREYESVVPVEVREGTSERVTVHVRVAGSLDEQREKHIT
jgi:hypothetical protein